MALSLIAYIAPNFRDYPNYWLKAYSPGTTTPLSLALDSSGLTTVAKLQLNADGFLESAGGALVIPYIEGSYDLWLFPTQAEADTDDTSNALCVADDVNALNVSIINDLSQTYNFDTMADYKAFTTEFPAGKRIYLADRNAYFIVISGTGTANTYNVIASTEVNQSIDLIVVDGVYLSQWGADYTEILDNYGVLSAGISYAQTAKIKLYLEGKVSYSTQLILSGSPISIVGDELAPNQQGSDLPRNALIWLGGASAMIDIQSTYFEFYGFAVENRGTATDFIEITSGIGYHFKNMSWLAGSGHNRFTRSVIRSSGNRLGYSRVEHVWCQSPAPVFIDVDGQGSTNGITPIHIYGRSLFESNSAGAMTVLKIKDENFDMVTIEDNTFNQQVNELTVVDTTDTPLTVAIQVLNFIKNEWDTNISVITDRMMRLENVKAFNFNGNQVNGGGTPDGLIELVNSNLTSSEGNYIIRVAGSVVNADGNSQVNPGLNTYDLSNTRGFLNSSAQGIIDTVFGGNVFINAHLAPLNTHKTFRVEPTSGAGYTVTYNNPVNGFNTVGQKITIEIKNTSGGAISAGSFVSGFKLSSAAVAPSDGHSFSYTFEWDGASYIERSRSFAETPN